MKIFISADIEGISTSTTREECHAGHPDYPAMADRMTREVLAACAGAFQAGATEIYVKDAHGSGTNIDPARMPGGVKLLRGWSGHPHCMVEGIDGSFDAALFVGYHAPAGRRGNPLAHTVSGTHCGLRVNGRDASEFYLYSLACAMEGVPSVFLSGDKFLCETEKDLHPRLVTLPVKEGFGNLTVNYSPEETLDAIKKSVCSALSQDLSDALIRLPDYFKAELHFKNPADALKSSYFPGVALADDSTVRFESDDYMDILRTVSWLL